MKKERNPYITLIVSEAIWMYVAIYIGDIFRVASSFGINIISRYIVVGIVTFITMWIYAKSFAKRVPKSTSDTYKTFIKIVPAIVAFLIILYGFYSVAHNAKELSGGLTRINNQYESILGDIVKEAVKQARMTWVKTALVHLIVAEIAVFLVGGKLDELFVADETVEGMEYQEKQPLSEYHNNSIENSTAQNGNIKWDL